MKTYNLKDLLNMKDDEEFELEKFEKVYPNSRTYNLTVTVVKSEEE